MFYEKVAVIGVGLIGGSFALALKGARRCGHVAGVGRSAANMKVAMERGIVDVVEDMASAVSNADLVLMATPVAQFSAVMQAVGKALKPAAARRGLGGKIAQFVPAHPIAGAEKSGAAAASAELFRQKRVVLTPLPENPPESLEKISAAWGACGARVSRMTPEEHDSVFAAVSHLPHLLAYALVSDISARADAAQLFGYAAGGFRDFTRIASSEPEMWRDICMANRDRLLNELHLYEAKLKTIGSLLETRDAPALEKRFAEARAVREKWLNGSWLNGEHE
jgi:prephenate dehydrogenase